MTSAQYRDYLRKGKKAKVAPKAAPPAPKEKAFSFLKHKGYGGGKYYTSYLKMTDGRTGRQDANTDDQ